MATCRIDGPKILIETDLLAAEVHTEGYVSGVARQSFLDKTTGARDLGSGLDIADFLLEPLADEPGGTECPYHCGDLHHGNMVKRFVELPQICTRAEKVPFEISRGEDWVAVRQWFRFQTAFYGRKPGSLWEQVIVFRDGLRYFLSADKITSLNTVEQLVFRTDLPGHLRHQNGDAFEQIHLSYHGTIPAAAFAEDFPPHERYLYQRSLDAVPERMIRAYQVRLDSAPGPWLAGMTLDPAIVFEAWCHQRGYVCFIQEIGGGTVAAGESFGAAYVIGWFDGIEDMHAAYDEHKGATGIEVDGAPRLIRG